MKYSRFLKKKNRDTDKCDVQGGKRGVAFTVFLAKQIVRGNVQRNV